jgi:Tfp pilus assembly protein PilZ
MELERKPELCQALQSPQRTENSFVGRLQALQQPAQPPVRRRHPRYAATFLIRLPDRGELNSYYSKDISTGGTFLRTTLLKQVGDLLELLLIHPETDQEFGLAAKVVRVVEAPCESEQGMGLAFEPLSPAQRDKLEIFIETGVAFLDGLPDLEAETERALQEAAIIESSSARVHFEWAKRLLYDHEDFKAAAAEFERTLGLDPGYAAVHEHLPLAYAMLGDTLRALEQMRLWRKHRRASSDGATAPA